ncbi:MAG: heavy metal translocating P-type ATPase, partial [Campylobacteraceae bacterium]
MKFQQMGKKEFILENLCCASCASGIEKDAKKLANVVDANVNFSTRVLELNVSTQNFEAIKEKIVEIAKTHDDKIVVIEKEEVVAGKKTLYLNGLDCASCASKIEEGAKNVKGIKNANVDFVTQKMIIEVFDKEDLPKLTREITAIIKDLEPDVIISSAKQKVLDSESNKEKYQKFAFVAGAVLFAVGMIFDFSSLVNFLIFLSAYLLVGGDVVLKALKNISNGKVFDENFLMSVATIGAFAIGEYPEGVAVMLFYKVGEAFQSLAVNRSRKSIESLMDIRADFANLQIGEEIKKVSPQEVGIGEIIIIKAGEKIPLDGVIIKGSSTLDVSALSGEALPKEVDVGNDVLSGSINKNGLLSVRVTKEFGESTVSKILELVQNATNKKAKTENFITKFAQIYTPIVVSLALLLAVIPPLLLPSATFSEWIYRALVFLVISCPCALVISIPLSFFGGIGGASRKGILVKGSNYLEALNSVHTVVLDKTGTLTKGIFKVNKVEVFNGFSKEEVLKNAAISESFSTHPIAISIINEYKEEIEKLQDIEIKELSGFGIEANFENRKVLVGNSKMMDRYNIAFEKQEEIGTIVYVAIDGIFAGVIVINDEIKEDSKYAVQALRDIGVKNIVMLSGDNKQRA